MPPRTHKLRLTVYSGVGLLLAWSVLIYCDQSYIVQGTLCIAIIAATAAWLAHTARMVYVLLPLFGAAPQKGRRWAKVNRGLFLTLLSLPFLEAGLAWLPTDVGASIPEPWKRVALQIPDATRAYRWHGHVHVHDEHSFRRTNGPFPPKQPGRPRVLCVGDSLTYGYGVAAESTYTAVLQARLPRAELINLGVSGHNSTEVLDTVHGVLARLQPDLIVYGVCLNDFLPAEVDEYTTRGSGFPLPDGFKELLLRQSQLARMAARGYDGLLMACGLRVSFISDIMRGKQAYRERFARDVTALNELVTGAGLPPVIGMVLEQFPSTRAPDRLALISFAEQALQEAGMRVVPIEAYLRRHDGQVFQVSRWEGHPNETAHRLFGDLLQPAIEQELAGRN